MYGMDGTDGAMLNNGTAAIGCGLGCVDSFVLGWAGVRQPSLGPHIVA